MSQKTVIPFSHVKPSVTHLGNNFFFDLTGRFITRFETLLSWIQSLGNSTVSTFTLDSCTINFYTIIPALPFLPTSPVGLRAIGLCHAEWNPSMTRNCVAWLKNYDFFFIKFTYLSCKLRSHCQVDKIPLTAGVCLTEFHHFYVRSESWLTYNSLRLPCSFLS